MRVLVGCMLLLSALSASAENIVYACGRNHHGQLGDGTTTSTTAPTTFSLPSPFPLGTTHVASGLSHSCVATTDGVGLCAGYNVYGQLGNENTQQSRAVGVEVVVDGRVVAVAAGDFHTVFLTSQGVFTTGRNDVGQLGIGSTLDKSLAQPVTALSSVRITHVFAASYTTFALSVDGDLYGWGDNAYGTVGDGTTVARLTPTLVPLPLGTTERVRHVSGGTSHVIVVVEGRSGGVYAWGRNNYGQLCDDSGTNVLEPTWVSVAGATVVSAAAGKEHSMFVTSTGGVYGCGRNNVGQLCLGGTVTSATTPTAVSGLSGHTVVKVSAGAAYSHLVTASGSAYGVLACGENTYGQLCDGTTANQASPKVVSGLAGVELAAVVANSHHTLLLTQMGFPATRTYVEVEMTVSGSSYEGPAVGISPSMQLAIRDTVAAVANVSTADVCLTRPEGLELGDALYLYVEEPYTAQDWTLDTVSENVDAASGSEVASQLNANVLELTGVEAGATSVAFSTDETKYSVTRSKSFTPSPSPSPSCVNPEGGLPRCSACGLNPTLWFIVLFLWALARRAA